MFADLPPAVVLALFAGFAVVIALVGVRMTDYADRIADRTGLGEAIVGGVILGAATSLSGTIVSISAAMEGRASLAFSNSIGGIAAQTAFLALADMAFRRANLEHAAAELTNLFQGILLIFLLLLPLGALVTPEVTWLSIHPVSFLIPTLYIAGLFVSKTVQETPMWTPVHTRHTRTDAPEEEDEQTARKSNLRLYGEFGVLMLIMGVAGYGIGQTGSAITDTLGLSASLVGALMTAVATSLPELVTTLAAVRRGALQLAVGGIIGGNTFDTLFLPLSDMAYRDGSLYHAATNQDYFWVVTSSLMTAILIGGLVVRERRGPAGIGFDSSALLLIYAGAIAVQVLAFGGGG
ncbi:sodium:calcium antiporter [Pseudooceanicola marinus]|uniref:sodium:calcium antiporter n=1 Tax=Pseudooceanicola marinus TaxID=396013 RepID=UPI001C945E0D|nr:sodium:calcium antiporter [Pseudooceanicola marinus]MBY5971718.1 sodium:calcium antiporter [Ferrimonas balearica]MCA1336093.1 sodium:calcium antiporter [Pseudooceanicola marinus]